MLEREVALYKNLCHRGVCVNFVTYGDSMDLEYRDRLPGIGIHCNRFGLRPKTYERFLPLLHAGVLRRSDVYKTNQIDGADVALRMARLWRKPLVARCGYMASDFAAREHGHESNEATRLRKLEETVFAAATRIVVTTSVMAKDVMARIADSAERIEVAPNYVDTELFAPAPEQNYLRDVLFVGRLHPQKNVESLLEAISEIGCSAKIIGDGPLRQSLMERFGDMKGRLEWVSTVDHKDLPRHINDSKIFVLPSHYEGHPKVLVEAMSCGASVIGCTAPGVQEVIEHGKTGWLCDHEADGLAIAIRHLLEQPELRRKLGNAARRCAVKRYGLDHIIEAELTRLQQVVGDSSGPWPIG